MKFDFLNDISLTESPTQATRSHVDHSPVEGADLRLFKDGRIYPSQKLVDTHNLEYVTKGDEVGNGFDIIDTINSPNYPQDNPRIVMIALTAKDNPKVDLFGSVGYEKDGTPKKTVTEQGSSTAGKWLITLLEEVYGETLFDDETRYVDLVIATEYGLTTPNNIYHMPKTVQRGAKKGNVTYARRTDTTLWPLTIMQEESKEEDTEVTEKESSTL